MYMYIHLHTIGLIGMPELGTVAFHFARNRCRFGWPILRWILSDCCVEKSFSVKVQSRTWIHCRRFSEFQHLVHSWTKDYRNFFNEVLHRDNGRNQQFVHSGMETHNISTKYHRYGRNGHCLVPLTNEQRLKFVMSNYTRAAHHCDQRWTSHGTQRL